MKKKKRLIPPSRCSGRLGIATLETSLISIFGGSVTLAEKLEVVYGYLCGELLGAVLARIGTGAEAAFYVELGAFADELFCYVCRLPPGYDVVPFSVLAKLSAAIAVALGCGEGECCDFSAGAICAVSIKVTYFGVSTNVTDKHYFVQTHI